MLNRNVKRRYLRIITPKFKEHIVYIPAYLKLRFKPPQIKIRTVTSDNLVAINNILKFHLIGHHLTVDSMSYLSLSP